MARARKRYDIYQQPGLFDHKGDPSRKTDPEPEGQWQPGKVILDGGPAMADRTESAAPVPPMAPSDSRLLKFLSFGSGSSGNCAYLGNERSGILIDAGIENDKIESALARHGIDMFKVTGIVLTHDHHDHVSHVYNILRNNRHMALFCTPKTFNGLLRRHSISRRIKDYHHPIYKETPFTIKDFRLTAFEVSHDGTDNVGYMIEYGPLTFVVATDMGFIGDRAHYYMSRANALMVESDYDETMLRTGRYPEYLKARIMADRGHLDNTQVASFLRGAWSPAMTHVFLCHLSQDNNSPAKASATAREALMQAGARAVGNGAETLADRDAPVQLFALPRFEPSPLFFIR